MTRTLRIFLIAGICGLAGCASVDNFGSRLNDINTNTSDALNDEALVNIVRAANYQGPNFVSLSQFTGGQTESLSTTLPTASWGTLAAADKAYHLANSVSSATSSSFESNPLVSTDFEEGILSPIDTRTFALLLNSNPREAVFYALIENITVKYNKGTYVYRSNPLNNMNADGSYDPDCYEHERGRHGPHKITDDHVCNYEKYQNLLDILIAGGLSVELNSAAMNASSDTSAAKLTDNKKDPNKKADDSKSDKKSSPAPTEGKMSEGRFCFNPSQIPAYKSGFASLAKTFECGIAKSGHINLNITGIGNVEIYAITVRSLTGIINFLGQLYRDNSADKIEYRTTIEGRNMNKNGGFLKIENGNGPQCIAEASYGGAKYCVPIGAYNTAAMIRIIQQIRNLQISPKDLNTSFSVRLGG